MPSDSSSFSPLTSGPPWLPVTLQPPAIPQRAAAKYSSGDGDSPIPTTSTPDARAPSTNPRSSPSDDGRLSRPTTIVAAPPARRRCVAYARPISRATSGVNSVSARPRTS